MSTLTSKEKKRAFLQNILMNDATVTTSATEDELSSNTMKLDIIEDCLQFTYYEGLTEDKIEVFIKFFYQLLQTTVIAGLPFDEAVAMFQHKMLELSLTSHFNDLFLTASIDYICTSLLQHYHLYTAAMCHEREHELHISDAIIQAPPREFVELSKGVPFHVWEMEEKIKKQDQEMRDQEEELSKTINESSEETLKELDDYMKTLEEMCPDEMNLKDISEVIKSIIEKHSDLTATQLDGILEKSKQMVLHKFKKIKILNSSKSIGEKSNFTGKASLLNVSKTKR